MKTDVYLIIYQLGKIAGKVWTITKISSFISVKVLDCRHFAILLQFSEDVAFPVTFIPNGESLFGWNRMTNRVLWRLSACGGDPKCVNVCGNCVQYVSLPPNTEPCPALVGPSEGVGVPPMHCLQFPRLGGQSLTLLT